MFPLRLLLSVLSFWFPLLLSAKALQRPSKNLQFLLLYWLGYIVVSNTQFYVAQSGFPLAEAVLIAGDILCLWMFYSHGCLVLAYYYLPGLLSAEDDALSTIDYLEFKLIDPFVSTFIVHNAVFQNILKLVSVRVLPFAELLNFNHELCSQYKLQKRLPFLQFSVDYFCYMDLPQELHARYVQSRRFLLGIHTATLRPAKRSGKRALKQLRSMPYMAQAKSRADSAGGLQELYQRAKSSRNGSGVDYVSPVFSPADTPESITPRRTTPVSHRTSSGSGPRSPHNGHLPNHTMQRSGVDELEILEAMSSSGLDALYAAQRRRRRASSFGSVDSTLQPPYPVGRPQH